MHASNGYGKKVWLIPDCYLNSISKNSNISHESICVINTSCEDAEIKLTLYFEDREAREDFYSFCGAKKTHHIRMDKLRDANGEPVPHDVPYAALIESSMPIVVQYSRLDTSAAEMALMTTIAYPVENHRHHNTHNTDIKLEDAIGTTVPAPEPQKWL